MAADIGAFVDSTSSADYFGTRNSRRTRPSLAPICERKLTTLQVPTLILHGSADRSAPLEATGRPTAALIPSCRLVVFDGAGHGLYPSEASRYNEEIIGFCHDPAYEQRVVPGVAHGSVRPEPNEAAELEEE